MNDDKERFNNIVEKTMRDLGSEMAKMYDKILLNQLQFKNPLFGSKCAKCQISMLSHNEKLGHPFFEDNLQYLEWEDEQRRSK